MVRAQLGRGPAGVPRRDAHARGVHAHTGELDQVAKERRARRFNLYLRTNVCCFAFHATVKKKLSVSTLRRTTAPFSRETYLLSGKLDRVVIRLTKFAKNRGRREWTRSLDFPRIRAPRWAERAFEDSPSVPAWFC